MLLFFARLLRSRKGATAVEYGFILALIFIVMLAGMRALSGASTDMWGNINNKVTAAH